MPAYNASAFISESIRSVQEQTYPHWELLVIDDGSADNTAALIQQLAQSDTRIKYFHQQNGKQGKARNKGIKEASGELVAFIDADDRWMKNKLESQVKFIQSANAHMVFADTIVTNKDGAQTADTWGVVNAVYSGDEGKLAFMQENKAPLLTVMAKKQSLLKVNGFDESKNMQYVEDYDLWLRMLQSGAVFASSAEKLACYRFDLQKTPERKRSLINVITALEKISLDDNSLEQKKNKAMMMWAGRIIKRCSPYVDRNDIGRIISLFPSGILKYFFSFLNVIMGASVTGKIMLLFTKKPLPLTGS